jgi:mannitol-1-phosphate 5-dehydrogenase
MVMLKAVHFGAGNIGRGLIGEVLNKDGFEITFIDINQELIDYLNANGKYVIEYADEKGTQVEIDNVSALNILADEKDIVNRVLEADLITTSIGMENLKKISKLMAKCLVARGLANKKIDLIANENAINATDQLKNEIQTQVSEDVWKMILKNTGFVNSAIDRQALSKDVDGLNIPVVEPYREWVVEKSKFKNAYVLEQLKNVICVDDLKPYIERKLYIVNAGHAIAAYVGYIFEKRTVQEALADEKIFKFVRKVMLINSRYLKSEYSMNDKDLELFIENTLKRHKSPYVKDEVSRVARSPMRKLKADERIVGPLLKLRKLGQLPKESIISVAAVLNYRDKDDLEALEMESILSQSGTELFLKTHCGIKDKKIIKAIEQAVGEIRNNRDSIFEGI